MDFSSISSIAKLIGDFGFLIIAAAIFIIFSVKIFNNQQKLLDKFSKDVQHIHTGEEENCLSVINDKIYFELHGLIGRLDADRAYVFLYHNGGVSSSGLYFQRMSSICEVVNEGILTISNECQNLHKASFNHLCTALKQIGYYYIDDIETIRSSDSFLYQWHASRHSESSYYHQLTDSKGFVIGFVGIDYCSLNSVPKDDKFKSLLLISAARISSLVDMRMEVE